MEQSLRMALADCLPADLIASLDLAGVVNVAVFLAVSLEEEEVEDGIRMSEIVDFLREHLPLWYPPAELRRFLPAGVNAVLYSDDAVIKAVRHWSLSPGYKFLLRAAQAALSGGLDLQDGEPPAKRPRLSTPAIHSSPRDLQSEEPQLSHQNQLPPSLPIERSQPATIAVEHQGPASGDKPRGSGGDEPVREDAVRQPSPQCSLTPTVRSGMEAELQQNVSDPGPASAVRKRRRRKRGKKGRSDANTSLPTRATLPVISSPVSTPVRAPPQPSSAHVFFDSDGDVAEQRSVDVLDRAVHLAKNRRQCKQRANFSAPGFPEMSKPAQLNSRQTNVSVFIQRGKNQLDAEKTQPASQLRNSKKRAFKVDIDSSSLSSSSSSSTSSSSEEVTANGKEDLQNHHPDSSGKTASGQTSSEQTEKEPRDYSSLPALSKPPSPGSLMAFKVLELNPATVTPEVSEFKEGILCSYDPHRDRCRIEVTTNRRRCDGEGKFDVRIDSPDGLLTNYEEEESVLLTSWSCLQEVKLIRESSPAS